MERLILGQGPFEGLSIGILASQDVKTMDGD